MSAFNYLSFALNEKAKRSVDSVSLDLPETIQCDHTRHRIKITLTRIRVNDDPSDIVQIEILPHIREFDPGNRPVKKPPIPESGEVVKWERSSDELTIRLVCVIA